MGGAKNYVVQNPEFSELRSPPSSYHFISKRKGAPLPYTKIVGSSDINPFSHMTT